MKSLIFISLITLLCFALCRSQFTAPDCQGNTTQGGYNPCRKRCDNLRNPPRFYHNRIGLDCRHMKKKYLL
ncbi:hypothetical protein CEXT_558561 [Caerostris extrusa]|uniref:Uncharacterized protein n=1 Tax=Caerostris extrusa TaxID=172846 RepID=A0AAV4V3T9_CAEEX|nr:hypothetical protein CEXT_558561 [Caerostris extrusa]